MDEDVCVCGHERRDHDLRCSGAVEYVIEGLPKRRACRCVGYETHPSLFPAPTP